MQVIISARGLTVSTTYKDALTRKLTKLEPLLPGLVETKIVLSKEKHRRTAALTVVAKHHVYRSVETAEDLAAAVDLAIAALGRQVRDTKDRVRAKKPRRMPARRAVLEDGGERAADRPAGARARMPADMPAGMVVRQVTPKPMSIEEAVDQLRLGRDQFMVFTNARTEVVNVIYRRRDGGLGLVEPVA